MNITEQKVKLAAKLYHYRDTVKRFYGEEYKEKILPYQNLVDSYAKEKGISSVSAAMKICEDEAISSHGWTVIIIMAAAVELSEPSVFEQTVKP